MYIDGLLDKERSVVKIVERVNGKRVHKEIPVDYSFFVEDEMGEFTSIFGKKLKRVVSRTNDDYLKVRNAFSHRKLYESDLNLVFRCLEQNYLGVEAPNPHVAFFDIETDFDKESGYSSPEDANNPIISISVYLAWLDQMICLAIPPQGMSAEEATAISHEVGNTILMRSEIEMLETFLSLIEDADVLSGWNSDFYDIPYIVNRIVKKMGKHEARRLCLWNEMPIKRVAARGGKEELTYLLKGRVHLDYMGLYKKYAYEEKASYSLDAISNVELGESKVPYDGTLDQLYNRDFKKFLEYNIQDTLLLYKLDRKLKYIDLVNEICHDNCVVFQTALGTVALVEQAITIEAHNRGMIVPSKSAEARWKEMEDEELFDVEDRAAGGYVATHDRGLLKWIGSSDINSLYPSVFRAFNMSPETLIGQIRLTETEAGIRAFIEEHGEKKFAEWWHGRFTVPEMDHFLNKEPGAILTIDMEDGTSFQASGAELNRIIFESDLKWAITANGTIFRQDIEGVIPSLFTRWYSERKKLQAKKVKFTSILEKSYESKSTQLNVEVSSRVELVNVYDFDFGLLDEKLEQNDFSLLEKFGLKIVDGKVVPQDQHKALWKAAEGYWDKKQLVKKILLNSAYGGVLNESMKFYDHRIGQSTTLSGRSITKHMSAKTNEFLCGVYDHYGKCIKYNDTDSVYFTAWPEIQADVRAGKIDWNRDIAVSLYDEISNEVSNTFPEFLNKTFNVPLDRGAVIKSGREIVAETMLIVTKKKYAALIFDKDGERLDKDGKPGKLKVTGLDIRRSDTPKFVQEFLREILMDVLLEKSEESVIEKIRTFKMETAEKSPWKLGAPKAVNKLSEFKAREAEFINNRLRGVQDKKITVPGHVRAAFNWNLLRGIHNDLETGRIVDGQKVIVCNLKQNDYGFDSIAYPVDESRLPEWFTTLPFDVELSIEKIVDNKVRNLLKVLDWDLSRTSASVQHFEALFEF